MFIGKSTVPAGTYYQPVPFVRQSVMTHPQFASLPLEIRDDQEEQPSSAGTLDTEGLLRAVLGCPWDLEVADTEAAKDTEQVDERRDLALQTRETVVDIRI